MIDSCVYVWGGCVSDRQRKAEDAVVPRRSSGGLAPRVVVIAAVVIVVVVNPPDVSLDEETASVAPHEEDRGEPRAVVLGPVRGRVVRKAVCNAQRWDVNRVAELSTVARFRIRLQTAKEKKERKVRVGRCYRKYCERDVRLRKWHEWNWVLELEVGPQRSPSHDGNIGGTNVRAIRTR